ncbi:peptidoglycan DD-metalloendopeptidase family protein [Mesorhizobium sp.]|uniref:peptidoglycan DD-metalloendopeptidase family protein n=1 Tax=Mesorhizobium sp. TaxID=1871066 RepID=UPI000FE73E55|nr:peptidoglycan DD-metalloendopeptidase family protein [Mesorhizobium sp.]RWQ24206.1 MAG: hypothetical protein EOR93_04625 [Mesorhizobium sp.]
MPDNKGQLDEIYEKLKSLEPLGSRAVLRRALAIVATQINELAADRILPLCEPFPDDRGPTSRREDGKLALPAAYAEMRSEDRRRSIMLDPEEALASQLADFYSDRLDVLEVRHTSTGFNALLKNAHYRAVDLLRARGHLINVLTVSELSREETISSLRSLAYILETRSSKTTKQPVFPDVGLLGREICHSVGVQAGSTQWRNNGTRLEQQFRDVFSCIDEDACCENAAYTKHGDWRWELVWEDTGDSSKPPPTNPPPFQQHPWENRCPVFPSPVVGTVASDWGWRTINGQTDFHAGIDIAVPVGTQVLAPVGGEIVHINRTSPGAETGVIVRTGSTIRQYWHVDPDASLHIGDNINAGAVLGLTANYPQPHLHFAQYNPPNGDWTKKSDSNSLNPCP